MTQVTYCSMTQNRLSETRHCLETVLPYVNQAVIVDGGSIDDTIFFLRNWSRQEPKLKFYLCPWKDNFSQQRNNYLKYVPDNTWALVSDPDEWFTDDLLKDLQAIIKFAEDNHKDMVGFRCNSISFRGPTQCHKSEDNYWKRLLFKKYPGTKYVGNPHESLANHPHQIMDTKYIYEHIKQEDIIWHRGVRNYYTAGGGPNLGNRNPYWNKLRDITSKLGINNWHDFEKYMLKGNISQEIKNEFITYISLKEIFPGMQDGLSEMREAYKTYFRIFHPEEEPDNLKNISIP